MSDIPIAMGQNSRALLLKSMGLMLIATLCFSCMHATVAKLTQELHPFQVAFFRNIFGLLALLPLLMRTRFTALRTKKIGLHALRGVANGCSMLLFFTSLSLIPLAEVTALSYAAPLFVTIGAVLVLGERIRARRIAALIVGFIGMLIILRPGFAEIGLGQILILSSTVLWAVSMIDIKILARTDSSLTISTYMLFFAIPISLAVSIPVWQTPDAWQFALLLLLGLLGSAGQVLFTEAFRHADTGVIMPLEFTKLIFAAILGFLIFGQMPDIFTWLGGAVIFASTCYIAYREHKLSKTSEPSSVAAK